MMLRSMGVVALGFVALCVLAQPSWGQSIRLSETDGAITVAHGKQTILVYNKTSPPVPEGIDPVYERSGFIHPVFTPAGDCITAAFPPDHAHQHGIFTAWVNTSYGDRQIDFWNLGARMGRVVHESVVSTRHDDDSATFETTMLYRIVTEPIVDVLRERWVVDVKAVGDDTFCFDITSTQTAITDTPLVVNQYHYGGMAFRGRMDWLSPNDGYAKQHPELKLAETRWTNSHGESRERANHSPTDWVAVSGSVESGHATLVVLSHPKNFRSPQAARVHPTKPYFCYSPCVDNSFTIDAAQPFTSKYRFLVSSKKLDTDWVDEQWKDWSKR